MATELAPLSDGCLRPQPGIFNQAGAMYLRSMVEISSGFNSLARLGGPGCTGVYKMIDRRFESYRLKPSRKLVNPVVKGTGVTSTGVT